METRKNEPTYRIDRAPTGRTAARSIYTEAIYTAAYWRLDVLLTIVPMSASTVWRKVRDRSFPQPVKLSARVTAWNRKAVLAWLAEREVA